MGAEEIFHRPVNKFDIVVEVVVGELSFAAPLELQRLCFAKPTHLVDHGDHVTDLVGLIGHAPVPQADIADQNATFFGLDADRRRDGALFFDQCFIQRSDDLVRARPDFGAAIVRGNIYRRDVDYQGGDWVRGVPIGPQG